MKNGQYEIHKNNKTPMISRDPEGQLIDIWHNHEMTSDFLCCFKGF